MKKLEYKMKPFAHGHDVNYDLEINDFLEPHSKSSNCWWSNLPLFDSGASNLKEHLTKLFNYAKNGQITSEQYSSDSLSTAKICPAIGAGVLDKSHLIKTPTDISITIDRQGGFAWKMADRVVRISSHVNSQFHTLSDNPFEGYINIKFELPIIIRTDNVPYMFLQPHYHKQDYPFTVLNGVIEGKHTKNQDLNINTLIKLPTTEEPVTHIIKAGTVLAYLWSPERLKLTEATQDIKRPLKKGFLGWK